MSEQVLELKAEDLRGQVVGGLIDRFRNYQCAYSLMDESQQKDVISDLTEFGEWIVKEAVKIVSDEGFHSVIGRLKKVDNDGSNLKGSIEVAHADESASEFFMAAGDIVRIVLSDPDRFMGGELPQADKDQPDLPIDDDGPVMDKGQAGNDLAA